MTLGRLLRFVLPAFAFVTLSLPAIAQNFDLVINNGRVVDPETGFDGVANVGINNGYITEITAADITGAREIDATGHVVAPGFIDYHSHGQDPFAYRLYARDGVTTPTGIPYVIVNGVVVVDDSVVQRVTPGVAIRNKVQN